MPDQSWSIAESFDRPNGTEIIGQVLTTPAFGSVWEDNFGDGGAICSGSGWAVTWHPTSGAAIQVRMPGGLMAMAPFESFHVLLELDAEDASLTDIGLYMDTGGAGDVWLSFIHDDIGGSYAVTAQKPDHTVTLHNVTGTHHTLEWSYAGGILTWLVDGAPFATHPIPSFLCPNQETPDGYVVRINARPDHNLMQFSMTGTILAGDPPEPDPERPALIKDMVIVATLEMHDIPGTPAVPAKPGYYTYDTKRVCGWVYQGPGHYVQVYDPATGQTNLVWHPDGPGGDVAIWTCTNQTVPVYHPATPAVPAVPGSSYSTTKYENGYNLGWNSGARSRALFTGDAIYQFASSPSVVGVIAGINIDDGTPVTYNGNTIDYGFYLARGTARVIRNGVLDPAGGAFTYDENTVFRVERAGGSIIFSKNGSPTYTIPSGAPSGDAWAEAALYAGNDVVYDSRISYNSAAPTTAKHGTIAGSMLPMTGLLSQGEHFELRGAMAPMEGLFTTGSIVPSYALINGDLSIFSGLFGMLTGEVGQIDAVMYPMEGLFADHKYGAIDAYMQPMEGWLLATEEPGTASFSSFATGKGTFDTKQMLIATFRSTGELLGLFEATVVEQAEFFGRAKLNDSWTFTSTQQAVLWSIATTVALAKVPEGDVETWVINLKGGLFGSTQYQQWDFNSYAKIGNSFYGASDGGLVLLEGDDDDGEPVRSVVSLGKKDGGNRLKKTFHECFVGVSGTGNLYVKVIAEGREYIYRTKAFDEEMKVQRATFGKGLRTNYVTLELYNEDGADFEIDTVQFTVLDMSRKTR